MPTLSELSSAESETEQKILDYEKQIMESFPQTDTKILSEYAGLLAYRNLLLDMKWKKGGG